MTSKIFNISPHKSGTRSFHEFCCAHALRSKHWCGPEIEAEAADYLKNRKCLGNFDFLHAFWSYYEDADVFADFPTPLAINGIARYFPDAKFVLTLRDTRAWIRSVRNHTWEKPLTFCERAFYAGITGREATEMHEYSDQELRRGYAEYAERTVAMIARYRSKDVAAGKKPVLVVKLDDPDIGAKVAAFIGFEQRYPFSHIA